MPTTTGIKTSAHPRGPGRLVANAALAGAAAAVATVVVAALARSANVSLEVAGNQLPLSAFSFWTFVAAVVGAVIAAVLRDRRRFVRTALVLTAVSLVPPLVAADDTVTAIVLVVSHLVAAAILIPALSGPLRRRAGSGPNDR